MKIIDFRNYLEIFKLIKPNKLFYFALLIINCIIEVCFILLPAFLMRIMIDAVVSSNMELFRSGVLITSVISFSGMLLFIIIQYLLFKSFYLTTASIRNKLFKNILELPISYIEGKHSGDIVSRLINDVNTMEGAYSWSFRAMMISIFSGISSAILMFIFDFRVSIVLFLIGAISILINSTQLKEIKEINENIQNDTGRYTENITNIVSGYMTIKSIQFEKEMIIKSQEINSSMYKNGMIIAKKSSLVSSINYFFSYVSFIGVIIFASYLGLKGINNLGSIVSVVFLSSNVNKMFGEINSMLMSVQSYTAGANRVMEVMEKKPEQSIMKANYLYSNNLMIEMSNIHFSYDSNKNILKGISLCIEEGKKVALVGPSGCGKSTIFKLILGFYNLEKGSISFNKKLFDSLEMSELRSLISYVPQDAYIFDGTIEDNIRYGRETASKEDIIAAAKAAFADEFIINQEKGYETIVGEFGVKLSGGQKQRIAIARAFIKDAPIILLDEATSALDSESEMYIQEALTYLMRGKTVLIITHRISTIENADLIYVIKDGIINDFGTHSHLVEECELYKNLYENKFREEIELEIEEEKVLEHSYISEDSIVNWEKSYINWERSYINWEATNKRTIYESEWIKFNSHDYLGLFYDNNEAKRKKTKKVIKVFITILIFGMAILCIIWSLLGKKYI